MQLNLQVLTQVLQTHFLNLDIDQLHLMYEESARLFVFTEDGEVRMEFGSTHSSESRGPQHYFTAQGCWVSVELAFDQNVEYTLVFDDFWEDEIPAQAELQSDLRANSRSIANELMLLAAHATAEDRHTCYHNRDLLVVGAASQSHPESVQIHLR